MKRLRKAVLCILAVWAVAAPRPSHAADKWLSIRSKNFLLVGNASQSAIRSVGRTLEEFRAGFAILFPSVVQQAGPPITVIVFKDDASFRPFKPLYQGKPANIAGYFQPGQDVNFIALTGNAETPRVIYHEFVHSLTKDATTPLPPWAAEGIAEVYSTFEIESNAKEMLLGKAIGEHLQTLSQSFLSINTLVSVKHDSPYYNEQTKQGIFYAESWAVMHYLMLANNRQRQPQLAKFIGLLGTGQSIDDSFREAFQEDYAKFEGDIRQYIGGLTFPAVQFKLQSKIDFEREMQVSPLTDAQAEYYLGDLLLHIGRTDAAEAQFQKAISLDSSFAPTFASLGLLRVRQGKPDEALQFLTKAVEGDSKNYMAHYYYATTLQTVSSANGDKLDPARLQLMRDHLRKTAELAPDFSPAYDMLGYVALVSQQELPQTEAILGKALSAAPGKRELRLRLAEVMMANNEPLPARAILAPLKNISDDDAIQRRAQSMLDAIQVRLENERALRDYNERRAAAEAEAKARAGAAVDSSRDNARNQQVDAPPSIRRREATATSKDETVETAKPTLKRPAGLQVEGALILIDCRQGMTLRVRIGNGNVDLHADDPSKIEFVSYTSAVSEFVTCGQLKTELPVLVVYKPGTDPSYLGQPLRVEFTGKK